MEIIYLLWLLHTGRGNACCAAKCDAVANKLTASNMFNYRVSFCRAASVSASSAGANTFRDKPFV